MNGQPELIVMGFVSTQLLAVVFAISAGAKLRALGRFRSGVRRYDIVPRRAIGVIAALVVLGEACIAAALFTGVVTTPALAASVVLLAAFVGIAMRNVRAAEPLPCYCFSMRGDDPQPVRALLRTVLLLAGVHPKVRTTGREMLRPWQVER